MRNLRPAWLLFALASPPLANLTDDEGKVCRVICEVLLADLFKDQAHVFGKIAADGGVIQPGDGSIADRHHDALPLYRQETIWHNMGIDLNRTTMANWLIRCTEEYFAPLVERIREDLVKRDILHADETVVQVLNVSGGNFNH